MYAGIEIRLPMEKGGRKADHVHTTKRSHEVAIGPNEQRQTCKHAVGGSTTYVSSGAINQFL